MDRNNLKDITIDEELVRDIAMHELHKEVDRMNINPVNQVRQQQEHKRLIRLKARDFLSRVYGDEGEL